MRKRDEAAVLHLPAAPQRPQARARVSAAMSIANEAAAPPSASLPPPRLPPSRAHPPTPVSVGNGTQVGFRSDEELFGWQKIEAQLARVRNASVRTIQSPDGDVIDCVPMHLQPVFEHPKLRGQKPESEPVERPRIATAVHGHGHADAAAMEGDGKEQGLQLCA